MCKPKGEVTKKSGGQFKNMLYFHFKFYNTLTFETELKKEEERKKET